MEEMEGYDASKYERPSVTVDVVIFALHKGELHVLLIQRKRPPYQDMWAIPGGFVQMDESLEMSARRELMEETAVADVYLEQLYTFGAPNRDPRTRVITVAYIALVPYSTINPKAGDDAAETAWFPMSKLPTVAFDHAEILEYAFTRLQYKLEYTTVGFELLPDHFTLTELQHAYESILGEKLDKRNFRNKIMAAKILEESGKMKQEGKGRPARLYHYRKDAVAEIKTRRLFP